MGRAGEGQAIMLRVVVEAGHGSGDPGAVGPGGITEAEVVAIVARALALRTDEAVRYEVKRRPTKIMGGLNAVLNAIRRNQPDVVISLHCDAGASNRHEGAVYYLKSDEMKVRGLASAKLADLIRQRMIGNVAETVTVKTAPILRARPDGSTYLLTPGILHRTAKRAAVLIELGFISDPHVAAAFASPKWQWNAGRVIDEALREWAKAA